MNGIFKEQRKAGVLMPIFSLPGEYGIGTLGKGAYAFVDWLQSAGMKTWQVLPLLPTSYGDSPYQSYASDALNYYFIDLSELVKDGLLVEDDLKELVWSDDERRVDYGRQYFQKAAVLKKAYTRFDKSNAEWQAFLAEGFYRDFALFKTLKKHFGDKSWSEWDEPYKSADKAALAEFSANHADEIAFWQFTQYLFLKQWRALKSYANERGIVIMGDMPIYVATDSVETWLHRKELFLLDKDGEPSLKAGVPPDAFSEDGQLWGNPVYDWKKMRKNGYAWWKARIDYALSLFDVVRIDHFRGFDRFFAIPADAETAKEGEWLPGPSDKLFTGMKDKNIVAEDLGIIDDGVRILLKKTGFPGMKVMMFAFDGNEENEHLPSQYVKNCVAYTGTHDNETLVEYMSNMDEDTRASFERTLEKQCILADVPYIVETENEECQSIIELLFSTVANTVIVPMHDVLAYDAEAHINAPSTVTGGNWTFRYTEKDFRRRKAAWLSELCLRYNR